MKKILILVCYLLLVPCLLFLAPLAHADQIEDLNNKINEYQSKLTELSGQKKTLSSTLAYLNTQISLTQSQIAKSEQELIILQKDIDTLNEQIGKLNLSLDELTTLLSHRVRGTYIQASENLPLYVLLSANGVTDLINRYKYLQVVQSNDKKIMVAMERSRQNYDLQKSLKEQKQSAVEAINNKLKKQKADLAAQQQDKNKLLGLTQNDERKYQTLLDNARAELAAIQNIIAGKGEETKIGDINEGNRIASIISGSSACSTGTHLHFEVAKNTVNQNPADYLSEKSVVWDNSPDGQFSFTGSWSWPLNDPVRITQGYGNTSYSSRYANHSHTGIDMVSTDTEVKAVKNGTFYRGSIGCGGSTLRYVKVEQSDSMITYYLHVNY